MKKFLVLTFVVLGVSAGGCSGNNRNDVIVIKKTGTYHRSQCPPVRMARTTVMTVAEAQQKKIKPCPACVKNL